MVEIEGLRDGNQADFPGLTAGRCGSSGDAGAGIFQPGLDVVSEGQATGSGFGSWGSGLSTIPNPEKRYFGIAPKIDLA